MKILNHKKAINATTKQLKAELRFLKDLLRLKNNSDLAYQYHDQITVLLGKEKDTTKEVAESLKHITTEAITGASLCNAQAVVECHFENETIFIDYPGAEGDHLPGSPTIQQITCKRSKDHKDNHMANNPFRVGDRVLEWPQVSIPNSEQDLSFSRSNPAGVSESETVSELSDTRKLEFCPMMFTKVGSPYGYKCTMVKGHQGNCNDVLSDTFAKEINRVIENKELNEMLQYCGKSYLDSVEQPRICIAPKDHKNECGFHSMLSIERLVKGYQDAMNKEGKA